MEMIGVHEALAGAQSPAAVRGTAGCTAIAKTTLRAMMDWLDFRSRRRMPGDKFPHACDAESAALA